MSDDFKVQVFDVPTYKNLIDSTNNIIHQNMAQYRTKFYETVRSNPMMHIHDYIYNTVKYGRFNNTINRLLFGGEVDYITLSIYDILAYLTIWRYFNVFNDVEYIKIRQNNPEADLRLDQTYGIKYVLHLRQHDIAFDRVFETISSPKIIKDTLDIIKSYQDYKLANDLYKRFELFGFVGYIDSIDNIDEYTQELQDESISKRQVVVVDIGEFANKDCRKLNSIYDYCQLIKPEVEGLKKYYIDNFFDLSDDELKAFATRKFQDSMNFAYSINYPIMYNIRK